jgi:hypothetical protein
LSQVKLTANNALNTATSSVDITPLLYTVSQKVGLTIHPRHQISTVNQIFYNNTGNENLRVDNSGVKINNVFYLPATVGNVGAQLTSDGAGNSSWVDPFVINPFDQDLNTFNDVSFNSVTTANITGPTTVKVAGNDRLVVAATETNLYSQDVLTGPTGSFLRLKNTASNEK